MKIGDKTIFAEIICSFLQYKNPSSTDLDDVLLAEVHQQFKIVHQLRQLKVGLPLLLEGGQGAVGGSAVLVWALLAGNGLVAGHDSLLPPRHVDHFDRARLVVLAQHLWGHNK